MSSRRRVAVVSPVADGLNTNWELRAHVAEGFAAVCGAENVIAAPEQGAVRAIDEHKPDLVVAFGGVMPDDVDLRSLRRAADRVGAHLAVWLHDDPYELDYAYRAVRVADSIFTNDAASVDYYDHRSVHHLPLAASPTVHHRPIQAEFSYDLFFCGFGFANRIAFFEDITDRELAPFRMLVAGAGWPESRAFYTNRRIPNRRLPDFYASSACTVTLSRDLDLGNKRYNVAQSTPGPRTFEAAMAGCVQLHFVSGLEVLDYFEADREILLIDRPSEVVQRLAELTNAPARLRELREATQARALRDHTYAARAATMLEACFSTA